MTDTSLLNSKIEEIGIKIKTICEILHLSRQGFNNKRNNKSEFTASEIDSLCDILRVKSLTERRKIFFANKVD